VRKGALKAAEAGAPATPANGAGGGGAHGGEGVVAGGGARAPHAGGQEESGWDGDDGGGSRVRSRAGSLARSSVSFTRRGGRMRAAAKRRTGEGGGREPE